MRTTLTLDPDVVRLIQDAVHRQRRPTKQVINDALRQALRPERAAGPPYHLEPHDSAVGPGVDIGRLNALADELEDEAVLADSMRPE
jgi:hypothetical protein